MPKNAQSSVNCINWKILLTVLCGLFCLAYYFQRPACAQFSSPDNENSPIAAGDLPSIDNSDLQLLNSCLNNLKANNLSGAHQSLVEISLKYPHRGDYQYLLQLSKTRLSREKWYQYKNLKPSKTFEVQNKNTDTKLIPNSASEKASEFKHPFISHWWFETTQNQ